MRALLFSPLSVCGEALQRELLQAAAFSLFIRCVSTERWISIYSPALQTTRTTATSAYCSVGALYFPSYNLLSLTQFHFLYFFARDSQQTQFSLSGSAGLAEFFGPRKTKILVFGMEVLRVDDLLHRKRSILVTESFHFHH